MNLELGEEITLNNKDKYIIMGVTTYADKRYVFLMNNDNDLVIKVGEEVIENDKVFVKIVKNKKIIKEIIEQVAGEKISD